jgi:hypothetical protein
MAASGSEKTQLQSRDEQVGALVAPCQIIYSADFYQHFYGARQVFIRIDHYVWDRLRILMISDSAPGIIKLS